MKAGGGHTITMGELCRQMLSKLEWYSTLFPRIPVPIQKSIEKNLQEYDDEQARPPPAAAGNKNLKNDITGFPLSWKRE